MQVNHDKLLMQSHILKLFQHSLEKTSHYVTQSIGQTDQNVCFSRFQVILLDLMTLLFVKREVVQDPMFAFEVYYFSTCQKGLRVWDWEIAITCYYLH